MTQTIVPRRCGVMQLDDWRHWWKCAFLILFFGATVSAQGQVDAGPEAATNTASTAPVATESVPANNSRNTDSQSPPIGGSAGEIPKADADTSEAVTRDEASSSNEPRPDVPAGPGALPSTTLRDTSRPPEELLSEALHSMQNAASALEAIEGLSQAVVDQQRAVDRLKLLLSSSQNKRRQSPASSQDQSQQPNSSEATSTSSANSAGSSESGEGHQRRQDDANVSESSEHVDGAVNEIDSHIISGSKMNSFWGHLPPRQREALFRSLSDHYLPEYEARIRRYYEALAEKK